MGDSEIVMVELLEELLEEVTGGKTKFQVFASSKADDLFQFAEAHQIDLYILHIYNILLPMRYNSLDARITKVMDIITNLKENCNKPVIALSCEPGLEQRALLAGADFFIRLPFEPDEMRRILSLICQGDLPAAAGRDKGSSLKLNSTAGC